MFKGKLHLFHISVNALYQSTFSMKSYITSKQIIYMFFITSFPGVKFLEGVGVNYVASQGNRVTGVETSLGFVHCNVFINCSGLVSRLLYCYLEFLEYEW